jgi:RNA polymerase sigma-70 factor (ECF subfamily)
MGLEPRHLSHLGKSILVAPRVERVRKRSFEQIYRDEVGAVRAFVKRIVRHASDADDLTQDTFIRCWHALDAGVVECPRAFLFRTARNLAFNHVRNGRARNSGASRRAAEEACKPQPLTAEDELIVLEEADACRRLLDQLPLRCREAFALWIAEEMSYKQLSQSMQLSVSTVEKHIGKGKQICRSLLTDPAREDILATRIPEPYRSARIRAQRALAIAAE